MTLLARGIVRAYDSATHTAQVQLATSHPSTLVSIPVATALHPVEVVAGRECAVLLLTDDNPADALLISVHNAVPGYHRLTSYGNVVGNATSVTTSMLLLKPESSGESVPTSRTALDIQPQWSPSAAALAFIGISGNALVTTGGNNQTSIFGLDFQAIASGAVITTMAGARVRVGVTTNTTVTKLQGLAVRSPSQIAGTLTTTDIIGVDIEQQGVGAPTNVYGVRIAGHTGGTNRYGIQAADIAGGTIASILELGPAVPHLRLEGSGNWAPGINTATSPLLILMGNNDNPLTKTLRRVQWKDGATLVAGDKVLIAI